MKSGAFIVVAALAYVAIGESVADYKGLAKGAFMAFSMAIFMFALAGIPPLSGFMSKVVLLGIGPSGRDRSGCCARAWHLSSALPCPFTTMCVSSSACT